jgi:hypothetical protein
VIDSQQLTTIATVRSANKSLLHGGAATGVGHDRLMLNASLRKVPPDLLATDIRPDNARGRSSNLETTEHVGNVRRSAKHRVLLLRLQDQNRGFLAHSAGFANRVLVQHQVAEHQDPGISSSGQEIVYRSFAHDSILG